MKKQAWLAMALLLCCVGCTPKEGSKATEAKETKEAKEKERNDKPAVKQSSIEGDFRSLDANGDGSLSKDEAEKNGSPVLQANFDTFDVSKDGKLSLQEVTAFVQAQRKEDVRRKEEAFRRIDADQDGGISKEEAEKESDPFLILSFDSIDVNKDGKMSLQELNTYAGRQPKKPEQTAQPAPSAQPGHPGKPGPLFMAVDKDGNGTLSRDELKAKPELYADFDKIDADHDGKITPKEIGSYVTAHSSPAQDQAKAAK